MPNQEQMARWYRPDGTVEQHGTHHHRIWQLTCQQFEELLERSRSACEVCRRSDVKLQIDHAHGTDWYVRGLLCPKCNTALKYVDSGFREPTEALRRYVRRNQ